MSLELTHDRVVLMGVRTAERQCAAGISRHAWVLEVLLEHLAQDLPVESPSYRALLRARRTQQIVTATAVQGATDRLVATDYLVPDGRGSAAAWRLRAHRMLEVDAMLDALTDAERIVFQKSAQRALAMSLAWSKTARAAAE